MFVLFIKKCEFNAYKSIFIPLIQIESSQIDAIAVLGSAHHKAEKNLWERMPYECKFIMENASPRTTIDYFRALTNVYGL